MPRSDCLPSSGPRAMDRAVRLFEFQHRRSDSPFVETVWRTHSVSEPPDGFISVAATH